MGTPNPLYTPGAHFEMVLRNFKPKYKKLANGPIYLIEAEIDRELWDLFSEADLKGLYVAAIATVVGEIKDHIDNPLPNPKRPKGPGSDMARKLHQSGFLSAVPVCDALGSDTEFQEFVRELPCVICGDGDYVDGELRNEYAHVRRVEAGAGTGIKPEYSGVAMCHEHHKLQHDKGETAAYLAGVGMKHIKLPKGDAESWNPEQIAKDYFNKMAYKARVQFVKYMLHAELDCDSLADVDPAFFMNWVDYRVPQIEWLVPREVAEMAKTANEQRTLVAPGES